MLKLLLIIFSGILLISHVNCANILCLMNVPSPSHLLWMRVLINGLSEQGHNLTVLSVDIEKVSPPNVHYIHLEKVYTHLKGFNLMDLSTEHFFRSFSAFQSTDELICEGSVNSAGFQQLMNYPDNFKFNLIIFDFGGGPCLLGFLHRFNYPKLVAVTPFGNAPFSNSIIGSHKQTAYVPYFALPFGTDMNIWQRITNIFLHTYTGLYTEWLHQPKLDEQMKKAFGKNVPSGRDLGNMATIIMINTHPSIDFLEPFPPNVIQVGGLQISKENPLPEEIKHFLEKTDKKTVYFSFGTNIKSEMMGFEMQTIFCQAFFELPQYNFLWKLDAPEFSCKVPSNILIRKWMPQNDILAHKNVKAFITHSGLLGTHEAIWHSVPMIGIPFYLDQHTNLDRTVRLGISERIPLKDLSVENLKKTIIKVLEDENMQSKMASVSNQFRDRPETPLKLAVWWIEFVLRNPDLSYMKSPVIKIGYFKANNYDILLIGFIISILCCFLVTKKCFARKINLEKKVKEYNKNK